MIGDYLEQYTFEYLLNSALARVPDSLDKREGSIIYDALAPACYELSTAYEEFRKLLIQTYVSTASGQYLDLRVAELGIDRYPATYASRRADFTYQDGAPAVIPIGSRFSTIVEANSLNYYVDSQYVDEQGKSVPGSYVLICEELGTKGNSYSGAILPINNIYNLATATLSTVLTPARDMETDEELRTRYFETLKTKAFGGNIAQYDSEIKAISGVGEVQIYPTWNGGGTVKCSIISADYNTVSTEFVANVQEKLDPPPQGQGLGIAPIGHVVSVVTPTQKVINVSAKVVISPRYTLAQLRSAIEQAISNYLLELRKDWGLPDEVNEYSLAVYTARINAAIISVAGVSNVSNVTINGSKDDLVLSETAQLQELPVMGTVTLYE